MMAMRLAGNVRHFLLLLVCGTLLTAACPTASGQVAPLAPRWLAGTPPPPVETFADRLAGHHIELTETALIAALRTRTARCAAWRRRSWRRWTTIRR